MTSDAQQAILDAVRGFAASQLIAAAIVEDAITPADEECLTCGGVADYDADECWTCHDARKVAAEFSRGFDQGHSESEDR